MKKDTIRLAVIGLGQRGVQLIDLCSEWMMLRL